MQTYMNWSGGKDSSLALYDCIQKGIPVSRLLTNMNGAYDRISMHGVRRSLLQAQAASIGLPLETIELAEQPTMTDYEEAVTKKLSSFKEQGIERAVFGDIFLEDLKQYREQQLARIGMRALFPLWKKDTRDLLHAFVDAGFKAIVVCTKAEVLGEGFAGRPLDLDFLRDLPPNVDPCGENGEYHSFVYDGPIFSKPIPFTKGVVVFKEYQAPTEQDTDTCFTKPQQSMGFYFCDLLPL
jgi:uncharacterized protein (TIGR00290 family)